VEQLFALVRRLARREPIGDDLPPTWLVERHGLAPMAACAGASHLRVELARAAVAWAVIERLVEPVVEVLVHAGVDVAPIKGASYVKWLYERGAERPMADVDLLVPAACVVAARGVLESIGFVRGPGVALHHAEAWIRDELAIDLHWNIIGSGRGHIDLEAVWARTVPGWPGAARRLEATDALAFHLLHLARNRLRLPLVNVVDTARLLEHADEQLARERARAWGVSAGVDLALRFCRGVLDGRAVDSWLVPNAHEAALLVEPTPIRKVAFDVAIAGSPRQLASRVMHFATNRLRATRQ
jgi:hypothetical protein